jgi:hypothetical protein
VIRLAQLAETRQKTDLLLPAAEKYVGGRYVSVEPARICVNGKTGYIV